MNVTLPEKMKFNKKQLIIYISILFVCIISIIIAFYVQFYARIDIGRLVGINSEVEFGNKTSEEVEELKNGFNQIFTNQIEDNGQNDSKKEEKDKSIVYTKYEKQESKLNSYELEIHIPHINIKNEIVEQYKEQNEPYMERLKKNHKDDYIDAIRYAVQSQKGE